MKKNKWIYGFKLLISIIVLAILYDRINHRQSILEAFHKANWINITSCILLLIANISLAYLKWAYLLKKKFPHISHRVTFGSLLLGYTLGLITPGHLGELGRGLFFQNENKLVVTGLNIIDKLANQIVIFTFGIISLIILLYTKSALADKNMAAILYPGLLLIVLLWWIILNPLKLKKSLQKFSRFLKPSSKIHSLISVYDHLILKDYLVILSLSFCWMIIIVIQYHLLVTAFTQVTFQESLQAVTATLFVKTLLPIAFGDLGIRESIAIFFYGLFQISEAAVFNASILIFLINFLLPATFGLYYIYRFKENKTIRVPY